MGKLAPILEIRGGVRQGDPISPLLFDFVVHGLALILDKANQAGHVSGVVPHLIARGIPHVQYADDMMILNYDLAIANMKFILICFELLSGLKINYHKSEVIVMGVNPREQARVANLLNCQEGAFSFKYLGFPMSDKKLMISDMEHLVAAVGKRTEPWQGRFMSSAACLVFTDACLSSLPIFAMGLFLLADGTHLGFYKHRDAFFWEGRGNKRKYHWVKWSEVCRPKDQGGLGVMNSKLTNIALMVKWVWCIFTESPDNCLWLHILRAKYPRADDMFNSTPQGGSPLWQSIYKVKHFFKLGGALQAWKWGADNVLE
jgi:hypothetical protein